MILAGIVLHNAEQKRLEENISAILPQVDKLVLVDNGSDSKDYKHIIQDLPDVEVIDNKANLGIATALNKILQYALDHDYEWALTLDQDSVAPGNLIETYKSIIPGKEKLGMVCCKIHDRNATMQRVERAETKDEYVTQCITSASMVCVKAWQDVGGFDDAMFIDSVDFDFSLMLRAKDWRIFRTVKTELLHEVGHSKVIKIFGKEYLSLNHSPFRYYYIVRNRIYLGRKHHFLMRCLPIVARDFWTVARHEDNKCAKLRRMTKGLFHGFFMPISVPFQRERQP